MPKEKNELFIRNNEKLKAPNVTEFLTQTEYKNRVSEIIKCKNDIIYFAENYFWIISLDQGKTIINLYEKQKDLLQLMKNEKRIVCLASRQTGKCFSDQTFIKIKNKKTGKIEEISVKELEKRCLLG